MSGSDECLVIEGERSLKQKHDQEQAECEQKTAARIEERKRCEEAAKEAERLKLQKEEGRIQRETDERERLRKQKEDEERSQKDKERSKKIAEAKQISNVSSHQTFIDDKVEVMFKWEENAQRVFITVRLFIMWGLI